MDETKKGFTFIELIVILAIVGLLVAFVFVALNPTDRLEQAHDAVRQTDVEKILSALEAYQADHEGSDLPTVSALENENVYMIVDGAMAVGCDDQNAACDTSVTDDTACVDLGELADTYLSVVPVSPSGHVTWDHGSVDGDTGTGYTLQTQEGGVIHIRACESEATTEIEASR